MMDNYPPGIDGGDPVRVDPGKVCMGVCGVELGYPAAAFRIPVTEAEETIVIGDPYCAVRGNVDIRMSVKREPEFFFGVFCP